MNIVDFIQLGNREPALRFLIIGGHAVGAHGHTRTTFDVDFLVRPEDREAWCKRLLDAGLKMTSETGTFAQFSQEKGDGFDLMFVNSATFEEMWAAKGSAAFRSEQAHIPSLDHLLALKLHALKQQPPHRTSKDAEDVYLLVIRNKLDISQPKYEQLFLKYGSREIYETIQCVVRYADGSDRS